MVRKDKSSKKVKPGLVNQKKVKTKVKAWGKGTEGSGRGGAEERAARGALKPVKLDLDKEGRDAILDILHKLHIEGASDGEEDEDHELEDEDEDDDLDEEDSVDDVEEVDKSEDDTLGSGGTKDGRIEGDGGFEYDGTFGVMANMISSTVVNDSQLVVAGTKTSKTGRGRADGKREDVERERGSFGGKGDEHDRGMSQKKKERDKLLTAMITEDRRTSKKSQAHQSSSMPSTVVEHGEKQYQRPERQEKMKEKVRLEVCAEKKKDGRPDVNNKKVVVIDRNKSVKDLMVMVQGKLHIKKKPKGAGLIQGGEVN
ncbi:unnamed protein product [Choristocarpus tenellus]